MINFDNLCGLDPNSAKAKLEELGYNVMIKDNYSKERTPEKRSTDLVVAVKQVGEKDIMLLTGKFVFLRE